MRRYLVVTAALVVLPAECDSEQAGIGPSQVGTTSSGVVSTSRIGTAELGCDVVAAISVAPEPNGEGFETPADAVGSYNQSINSLPDGEWRLFNGERWILVDKDGETVGRANVSAITEIAVTTFGSERYWSGDIEYCP